MSNIFIQEVNTPDLEQVWLELPLKLYAGNPNKPYMQLDDTGKIFDHSSNSLLKTGEVKRWLAYDEYNLCAGRIAAYVPKPVAAGNQPGEGKIGFFESIQNERVAHSLLSVAESWILSHNIKGIEGPVNFGEKDRFWGLMTEGFDSKGLYLDNFNPSWYELYFLSYGFRSAEVIYTYKLDRKKVPDQKIKSISDWSRSKYAFELVHFSWNETDRFARYIHTIYKAAFNASRRIEHLTKNDILHLIQQVKPLLKEKFCWFAIKNNEPLGFLLFLQEPPSGFQQREKMLKGFAFATIPAYRGKGVEMALCNAFNEQLKKEENSYELMLSGINSISVKMNSLLEKIGGEINKIHKTYTYKSST